MNDYKFDLNKKQVDILMEILEPEVKLYYEIKKEKSIL
jgi:hypothetical protein